MFTKYYQVGLCVSFHNFSRLFYNYKTQKQFIHKSLFAENLHRVARIISLSPLTRNFTYLRTLLIYRMLFVASNLAFKWNFNATSYHKDRELIHIAIATPPFAAVLAGYRSPTITHNNISPIMLRGSARAVSSDRVPYRYPLPSISD